MKRFFRYPHTPHIKWLGEGLTRDDKVLSGHDVEELLSAEVIVEEKVDGANIGISMGRERCLFVQNRGHYLERPYGGQFSRLSSWLAAHGENILNIVPDNLILFGEWCAAVHSVEYDMLPDWFLLFDVYSIGQEKFWSVNRRNALARQAGLVVVPELFRGVVTIPDLLGFVEGKSRLGQNLTEGIVVRRDSGDWCEQRGKIVRSDFAQSIAEHWSRLPRKWNRVANRCN